MQPSQTNNAGADINAACIIGYKVVASKLQCFRGGLYVSAALHVESVTQAAPDWGLLV